jgi:hypothetical protein
MDLNMARDEIKKLEYTSAVRILENTLKLLNPY